MQYAYYLSKNVLKNLCQSFRILTKIGVHLYGGKRTQKHIQNYLCNYLNVNADKNARQKINFLTSRKKFPDVKKFSRRRQEILKRTYKRITPAHYFYKNVLKNLCQSSKTLTRLDVRAYAIRPYNGNAARIVKIKKLSFF